MGRPKIEFERVSVPGGENSGNIHRVTTVSSGGGGDSLIFTGALGQDV